MFEQTIKILTIQPLRQFELIGTLNRSWMLSQKLDVPPVYVDEYTIIELNKRKQNLVVRIGRQGLKHFMECDNYPDLDTNIYKPIVKPMPSNDIYLEKLFSLFHDTLDDLFSNNKGKHVDEKTSISFQTTDVNMPMNRLRSQRTEKENMLTEKTSILDEKEGIQQTMPICNEEFYF